MPMHHGADIISNMLSFAKLEIDAGLLSSADWNRVFIFTGALSKQDDDLTTIASSVDTEKASKRLYGGSVPQEKPWSTRFKEIEAWLLAENNVTPTPAKRDLLQTVQSERVFQIRERFQNRGPIPATNFIHLLLKETAILRQLVDKLCSKTSKDDRDLRWSVFSDIITLSFADPMGKPLVTDTDLESAQQDGEALAKEYRKRGSYINEYVILRQLARIAAQRNQRFKSISLSKTLEYTERGELLFNDMKRHQFLFQEGVPMEVKTELSRKIDHQDLYDHALNWSLVYYNQASNQLFQLEATKATEQAFKEQQKLRIKHYEDFLIWTHRSKGRSLLETFGLRNKIPVSLLAQVESSPDSAKKLAAEQALVQQVADETVQNKSKLQQTLLEKREELRADAITKPIMDIRDGTIPTISQIREMVNDFGNNVVLVDYVHINFQEPLERKMAIKMIVYRKNVIHDRIPIWHISMEDIENWVERNLNGKKAGYLTSEQESSEQLRMCASLIEPLARSESRDGWLGLKGGETLTKPGDTIVFCPTKSMHQIPLHALPLKGAPLIQRNPVVYCQSLPTLRTNYELYKDRKKIAKRNAQTTVIHSLLPQEYSTVPVKNIALSLDAKFKSGVDLIESEVLDTFDGSNLLYYHGHVEFNEHNAMNSELALDHDRPQQPDPNPPTNQTSRRITAQKIWDTKLNHPPYHVHIIGCRSGRAQNLGADDLLGFPTAFQFAGANSVVSTLWKIRDLDGSDFSMAFFESLRQQKEDLEVPLKDDAELDLAVAVRAAVIALLGRRDVEVGVTYQAAYHWAGFVMHGYWRIPAWCVNFSK